MAVVVRPRLHGDLPRYDYVAMIVKVELFSTFENQGDKHSRKPKRVLRLLTTAYLVVLVTCLVLRSLYVSAGG